MRKMSSGFLGAMIAASAMLLAAAPAHAQQVSDSYQFIDAIKKQDGAKVMKVLTDTYGSIIDTRDQASGDAALHYIVRQGDGTWLRYLIQKGANPNIQDRRGNTPLMLAVEQNYAEGVSILITYKADVNLANSSGETPLIRAVQQRKFNMVRLLLDAGADPDKADNLAGNSARDYARLDPRMPPSIAKALQDAPKVNKGATTGPKL